MNIRTIFELPTKCFDQLLKLATCCSFKNVGLEIIHDVDSVIRNNIALFKILKQRRPTVVDF